MLSLRDFFYLPQVDPFIEQIAHEPAGLILVAGMDPLTHSVAGESTPFIPSGRAGIFRILVRQILEENPHLQATVIAENREALRVPRNLQRRVNFERVDDSNGYTELLPAIAQLHPGLLVVDQLTPENSSVVFEAAQKGKRIITQMDTVFRGAEIKRVLLNWGLPRSKLSGLRWVIAMQRLPMLCACKRFQIPESALIEAIQQRYPHLEIDPTAEYFVPAACEDCEHTGRRNEITAFDFYRANPENPSDEASQLPLEAYLLGLAQQGSLPLSDLLRLESDQLQRTYHLLTTSERALAESKAALERKIIELETANRVLTNRTEELISLQEIGQALIGTSTLRELAQKVCRQASALCGADRAIFYFLRDEENADVLATHGWATGRVPPRVNSSEVCDPASGPAPSPFNRWPPGVQVRHPDVEGARLNAGLRVPLVAQGQPVGAMIVHATTQRRFQPGAVALLQTFANQAAIAIQRAGLIENLRDKIVQLEAAQVGLAQKERLERELELAREVQQAVLPHTFPAIPGYQFAARNRPARQVGGDFYDVIDLGAGRFGLVVADVSDKGMPAAVYMALTRSLMVAEARREASPRAVLENVNDLLRELGPARMFVTVFYAIVDGPDRKLTYARAGHDWPLLLRCGQVRELKGDGMILGFLGSEELRLTEETLKLDPADRLILYTDGLTDTASPAGERFDRAGLHALLKEVGNLPAEALCEAIFERLLDFQGSAVQFDDMTLLVVAVDSASTLASRRMLPASGKGEHAGSISFTPMDESAAREIITWCYDPPYDIYNLEDSEKSIQYALEPQNNFYTMRDVRGDLVGFCSFGADAQVPGGDYRESAMDIGMGIRPDLTGQGRGSNFVAEVLSFANEQFQPATFRVTIAAFNQRAQRVWEMHGFRPIQRFTHLESERDFVVMLSESTSQQFDNLATS